MDTLLTIFACISIVAVGFVGVAVLPWRAADLEATARAWATVARVPVELFTALAQMPARRQPVTRPERRRTVGRHLATLETLAPLTR